jgi:hypothetical protein
VIAIAPVEGLYRSNLALVQQRRLIASTSSASQELIGAKHPSVSMDHGVLDGMRGLIPYSRIESNVRLSKHRVQRWLEERSFQPRPVNGNGAKRQ